MILVSFLDPSKKSKIEKALKDYEANTCLRFVPRTNQKHFLHFRNGNGYINRLFVRLFVCDNT